ncbi:MAG: hypothetical protein HUK25_06230 [Treponema sp.]|nr:hypothetical protein [Treponema sp.]
MGNAEKVEKFSLFEIIIIACLISVVLSPVGLVLMWIKSGWSKKIKIILTGVFALLYILIIVLFLALSGSSSSGGNSNMPDFGIESDGGGSGGGGKIKENKNKKARSGSGKNSNSSKNVTSDSPSSFVQKVKKSRFTYFFIFLILIAVIVVLRNLKFKKIKPKDNPYVDTSLYTIPVPEHFEFPSVHYTKFMPLSGETIIFACPAETKDNAGDIIITNTRFIFHGKKGDVIIPIGELTAISSMSNTALSVSANEKNFYFFVKDTQMRFVLQITRWLYANETRIPGEQSEIHSEEELK